MSVYFLKSHADKTPERNVLDSVLHYIMTSHVFQDFDQGYFFPLILRYVKLF